VSISPRWPTIRTQRSGKAPKARGYRIPLVAEDGFERLFAATDQEVIEET